MNIIMLPGQILLGVRVGWGEGWIQKVEFPSVNYFVCQLTASI